MSRRGLARIAAKRDANEPEIVAALEAQGFSVLRLSGKGIPDLLVGYWGVNAFGTLVWLMWLVEIKNPKGKNRATEAQTKLPERWPGPPPITLRSVSDAERFMLLACEHANDK